MKKYKIIIFDLDGTLSDSGVGITKCVQYALKKLNIIEEDLNNLKHFVGPPLKDELMKTYGCSEAEAKQGVEFYRERYTPVGIYETSLYENVEQLLVSLKERGKIIALATSKPLGMAEEVIKYLQIEQYFDYIMGADLNGPIHNKKDVLLALLEKFGFMNKNEMVMIGDTIFDIEGANSVGIDSIGVSYGYGNIEEMQEKGAKAIADAPLELLKLV